MLALLSSDRQLQLMHQLNYLHHLCYLTLYHDYLHRHMHLLPPADTLLLRVLKIYVLY